MMGMGMGVGFSSPPPWTPAAVPGSILYEGAYLEARATKVAPYTLTDADMEAAGVGTWTALYGGTTLTKESGAPGGTGTQVLRITSAGMADAAKFSGSFPIGVRERHSVWARVATASNVSISDQVGMSINMDATANWQRLTGEGTSKGKDWRDLSKQAATAWAEFDDWSVEVLSIQSYTPAFTTVAGSVLAQATATAMPWAGALGMMFDGDVMPWNAAASNVKCGHDGTGGTIGIAYRPTTLKAENRIFATAATAVGNVGVTVSCTNANTIRVRVMNGGAGYDYDSGDVACAIAINTTYAMVLRVASGAGGVSLRVNGTEVISGALTAPSAANPTTGLMLGGDAVGAAQNITGYIGQVWVVQRAITVAECAQYEAYVAAGGL